MNQLSPKIVVFALSALLMGGAAIEAQNQKSTQNDDDVQHPRAQRQKKQKKAYDLGANPLAGVQSKQPDKELYDKAMVAMKKGRYDVARLDLQTMLNTYPESEYRMRAKLSVGDTWFKEGRLRCLDSG